MTDTPYHEAIETELTVQDTSRDLDKESTEVNTRKIELKNTLPKDEQQHKKKQQDIKHKKQKHAK